MYGNVCFCTSKLFVLPAVVAAGASDTYFEL